MIEVIGWITIVVGGGYIAFCVGSTFAYAMSKGGLESLVYVLTGGIIGVAAWIAFSLWLSPLTIGWGP